MYLALKYINRKKFEHQLIINLRYNVIKIYLVYLKVKVQQKMLKVDRFLKEQRIGNENNKKNLLL